jgi:hypothetical protein
MKPLEYEVFIQVVSHKIFKDTCQGPGPHAEQKLMSLYHSCDNIFVGSDNIVLPIDPKNPDPDHLVLTVVN